MLSMLGFGFAPGLSGQAKLVRSLVAALVLVGLLALSYCQGRSDGKAHVELVNQKAINKAIVRDRQSAERRQREETAAAVRQAQVKAAYDTAIASAPGGRNSPAAHALACERLRQAYGAGSANIPASCRPAGGNAAEAAPAAQHR